MRAESSSTNFVVGGNVRQNAESFPQTDLFNKVGAVKGYPGPLTGIAAAAGNPGPEIVMNGGRSPSPGPDYQSFEDGLDLRAGVYGKNGAPVKVCNNNQCGGRKHRRGRTRKSTRGRPRLHKKSRRGPKRHQSRGRKSKHQKRKSKSGNKTRVGRRTRRTARKYLKDVRDLFRMGGGSPATVPSGSNSNGYHQYLSNQPFTNSYAQGGNLSPSENALANPTLTTPTNNCPK